jgi:hypothetical protein
MAPVLEGKSIGQEQKQTALKGELLMIWRTRNQAMDQGTVQPKDSICFQISPNLVPRKLDPEPWSIVGLRLAPNLAKFEFHLVHFPFLITFNQSLLLWCILHL